MQVLIGKTGKGSLKRRVAECSAENIPLPVAERALVLLQQFDAITIQDTSLGCATFHAWVSTVIILVVSVGLRWSCVKTRRVSAVWGIALLI